MYGRDELNFLSKLKGKVYALPLDYETPALANEILSGQKSATIQPVKKISLETGRVRTLARGYMIDVDGHKTYHWDGSREQFIPEGLDLELSTSQYLKFALGKEMGETDLFLQYLLGEFLMLCMVKQHRDYRVVIEGKSNVGDIILSSLDYDDCYEINPTAEFASTKFLVGRTKAIYDLDKLKRARIMAKNEHSIMVGLVCVEAEESHAEFRALGDEDGCVVLFNARFNQTKPGHSLDLAPGEHTLMPWDIDAPMAIVEYAPMFCIDKSTRDAYAELEMKGGVGK